MKPLTEIEKAFCREYMIDLNGAKAVRRAGYFSERTATGTSPNATSTKPDANSHNYGAWAYQLLRKPHIKEEIATLIEQRNQRMQADADYVLKRLLEIDAMDIADILDDDGNPLPVRQWPDSWRRSIQGFEVMQMMAGGNDAPTPALLKKIKWPDKTKNLELLGKHVNVQAFREQVKAEHTTTDELSSLMDSLSGKASH